MKTEMKMLPNGNYESVISPIQHQCTKDWWVCKEYAWIIGKLFLTIECGDPYEDGCSHEIEVDYCPFCGYKSPKIKSDL